MLTILLEGGRGNEKGGGWWKVAGRVRREEEGGRGSEERGGRWQGE